MNAPSSNQPVRYDFSLLSAEDIFLFNEGRHYRLYQKLGAHLVNHDGVDGTYFAVWAPNARQVSVMGTFNGWSKTSHALRARESSGIWEGFVPEATKGAHYKFHVLSSQDNYAVDKADPLAIFDETPPRTHSILWDLGYQWSDQDWMAKRAANNALTSPISIYEVHLPSWRRVPEDGLRPLSYREVGPQLADYVNKMGWTHVEFLPIMEHPFLGSWGYQTTGYFAPTSRLGTPQDFMYLIDYLHQRGIGVILDWVPSHFPSDEHSLGYFDGTHLYEHADPRQGFHPDWDSFIFNYGRREVQAFLISSALFWLDKYHIDGLRVDAVASMLYLDYSRRAGEWVPNRYGGKENLAALEFLRQLNQEVYSNYPDVQTIAEESTAWPMVSRPSVQGGLGFGLKWDMGWMHDTLLYFSQDALFRKYHQDKLTFRLLYAYTENFVLPLSHDEVVHGKQSLIAKFPGDYSQKFANLRLLFGYMYAQPGKKLLFMGDEFGQFNEWNHDSSLDWHLLNCPSHQGIQRWLADLNRMYRRERALSELDYDSYGFFWIDVTDSPRSVISLARQTRFPGDMVIAIFNFTPVPRLDYRLGVPFQGAWSEILNSDAREYEGYGYGNLGGVQSDAIPYHNQPYSLKLTLPPLAALFLKHL
jgi:1,4-alpha-glucan branching enzyme